jgi:hypothetical protein
MLQTLMDNTIQKMRLDTQKGGIKKEVINRKLIQPWQAKVMSVTQKRVVCHKYQKRVPGERRSGLYTNTSANINESHHY